MGWVRNESFRVKYLASVPMLAASEMKGCPILYARHFVNFK